MVFCTCATATNFKPIMGFIWDRGPATNLSNFPVFADAKKFPEDSWGNTYIWVDNNNDQTVQADELTLIGPSWYRTFHWVDKDLNIWHGGGYKIVTKADGTKTHEMVNTPTCIYHAVRIEPDGRPIYDFENPELLPVGGAGILSTYPDPEDDSVYFQNPSEEDTTVSFGRKTHDGKLLWGYRGGMKWWQALTKPPQEPGKPWGQTCPLYVAGQFTGISTYFAAYHIYTRDGLYVAMLMRDLRAKPGLGPDANAVETWNGQLVNPPGTNKFYLLHGDQDGRISEVLGLDTVKRLPGGTYEITADDAQQAAAAMTQYLSQKAKSQKLIIARGGLRGLEAAQSIEKVANGTQSFRASASLDEKNLYVSYDVTSNAELVNETAEPKLIFRGGNLLDIQLATDPSADPKRKTPAPGDLRILISRQHDKPYAVIFRPKVEGLYRGADGAEFVDWQGIVRRHRDHR